MSMTVRFGGGRIVTAEVKGFTIPTDLPTSLGGPVTAPSPVHLLLASLGTCTGGFLLSYCNREGLSTEGITLSVDETRHPETRMVTAVKVSIHFPKAFPEEHIEPALAASSQCTIKTLMEDNPSIQTVAEREA